MKRLIAVVFIAFPLAALYSQSAVPCLYEPWNDPSQLPGRWEIKLWDVGDPPTEANADSPVLDFHIRLEANKSVLAIGYSGRGVDEGLWDLRFGIVVISLMDGLFTLDPNKVHDGFYWIVFETYDRENRHIVMKVGTMEREGS